MSLQKYTPQQVFKNDSIQKRFEKILGENARGFVTSVLQVINDSSKLQKASSDSVYSAAMTAASLDLPVNPNLGFAYIIPYDNKGGCVATFQLGYRGYIQLAQRTGMYDTISSTEIYEGQLVKENPLTGYEFDFDVRVSDTVIGYASYFKLHNGFNKTLYMSKDEIENHAVRYSQAYRGSNSKQKSYGPWVDNFDGMAKKTVLKLLISKFGPLSVDMQTALIADQAEVKDVNSLEVTYPDNDQSDPQQPTEGREEMDIAPSMKQMEADNADGPF